MHAYPNKTTFMPKIKYPNFWFKLTRFCFEAEHINHLIKIKKLLSSKSRYQQNMEFVLQGSHIADLVVNYGISNTIVLETP